MHKQYLHMDVSMACRLVNLIDMVIDNNILHGRPIDEVHDIQVHL